MKNFIRRILSILYMVYPYNLHQAIIKKQNFLYTCWVSNAFSSVGRGTRFIYKIYTRGGHNISIGDNCIFHRGTIIDAWDDYHGVKYNPSIQIGDHCSFGAYTQLTACNGIKIGDNLLTGAYVIISDNNHGQFSEDELKCDPRERRLHSKGEVVIGNNVWLGDKVAVLSGVHIGDGVVVAANAVVTKDIPPYSLAAGVPAKVIKQLNKNNE